MPSTCSALSPNNRAITPLLLVHSWGSLSGERVIPQYSSKRVAPRLKTVPFGALPPDKAFDTNGLLTKLDARGATAGIPPRAVRKHQGACDREAYKWRHLMENVFASTKESRGGATRYDKTDTAMPHTGTRPSLMAPYGTGIM